MKLIVYDFDIDFVIIKIFVVIELFVIKIGNFDILMVVEIVVVVGNVFGYEYMVICGIISEFCCMV